MSKAAKRLDRMRANPRDDWTINDVQSVCEGHGILCKAHKRGSHHTVSHSCSEEILTIPADRPIKAVYIKKLVKFVDEVLECDQ